MANEDTNLEAATQFIEATPEAALRRAATRHKSWAKILRGFRPQALTRSLLLTHAGEFAAAPALLQTLAEAFLDGARIPKASRLAERLTAAADRADLPEAVREVCRQLAGDTSPATIESPPSADEAPPASEPPETPKARRPRARKAAPPS